MSLAVLLGALALGAFVHRPLLARFGVGTFQHLVRLPGNLLHELSHAVAMLATGYTIANFTVSLTDDAGRGQVRPGPAWIGLARPWMTNLVSPVAPVVAGVAALVTLHGWSGAPGIPTAIGGVAPVLRAVPWEHWQLWAGLALAFSVTAEMAPSDVDLAAWWRPALGLAIIGTAVAFGVEHYQPGLVLAEVHTLDAGTRAAFGQALAMAVWSGVAIGPIAWLVGRLRG